MQLFRRLAPTLFIRYPSIHHRSSSIRLFYASKNMGHGGRGRGDGGYDWRKHIRPSGDPTVQNEVRESVKQFLDDPNKSMKKEIKCGGEVKNWHVGDS